VKLIVLAFVDSNYFGHSHIVELVLEALHSHGFVECWWWFILLGLYVWPCLDLVDIVAGISLFFDVLGLPSKQSTADIGSVCVSLG
jgi:hypothetical protein